MSWSGCKILVPLLLLNVLAAEAYAGNDGSWNSRNFNLRRPLYNTKPNPIVQPIHNIPRPLPKPVEIQKDLIEPPITESPVAEQPVTEIVSDDRIYDQPTARLSRPNRFNLHRQPIVAPQPTPITSPRPITTEPIYASISAMSDSEPAIIEPENSEIADDRLIPVSPSEEIISVTSSIPPEDSVNSEDIEVSISHSSPEPSPSRRPLPHYLMAKPLPPPTNTAPIKSVTIIKEEPIPEDDAKLTSSIVETSSILPISRSSEQFEILPEQIQAEIEEPKIVEEKSAEPIIPGAPVEIKTQPIMEKSPEIPVVSASPIRAQLRERRPITRIPQPIAPKSIISTVSETVRSIYSARPLIPPRVTSKPSSAISTPFKPTPIRPTPVKPIPVKPVPNVSIPPVKLIPKTIPATSTLMDYMCDQENVYHSISNDCDSYVECKSYVPTMSICPDGLHFNHLAIWPDYPCAYPSEVQCESNAYRHDPQPTEQCPRQYGLFPMGDSDCSRYLMCQEGMATIMNCPPGLVFNKVTATCDWPANVPTCNSEVFRGFTCPAPPLEEDGTPSDIILKFRYGQSCKEYIACQLGHPRLLSCDRGLSFDEESQVCVDSDYVQNCRA